MKIKDLIEALSELDPELEVAVEAQNEGYNLLESVEEVALLKADYGGAANNYYTFGDYVHSGHPAAKAGAFKHLVVLV